MKTQNHEAVSAGERAYDRDLYLRQTVFEMIGASSGVPNEFSYLYGATGEKYLTSGFDLSDRTPGRGPTLYLIVGAIATVLAVAGIVLPILPATPFLLVAAWAFGHSSPRFERWLLEHRHLGPPVRSWRESGSIAVRSKILALSAMAGSFAYLYMSAVKNPAILIITAIALVCCAAFILSRPSTAPLK